MKRKLLLLLVTMLSMLASAYDAKIDGIYYNFSGNEAEVTYEYVREGIDEYTCDIYYIYFSNYSSAVVIPESVTYNGKTYRVTSIGSYAFYNCSDLTSVTIPNSVTSIRYAAFSGCSGLTSVTIPNSVTSIGYDAFSGCSGLTSVTIPGSVTSIGDYAFQDCSGLTSVAIGNGVTRIGYWAFARCSGLTSVTIGNNVTSIGGGAFNGCSSLTKVIVPDIAAWCSISFDNYFFDGIEYDNEDANPLYYAHHLYSDENTKITDLVIPSGVTSISEIAFLCCRSLTSVTIPNSVTSIGERAFARCSGLTSVTIGNNVTSIEDDAFYDCTSIVSVTVPVSDSSSFCENKALGCISSSIGKPVMLIDNEGAEIKEYVVPDGVTSIYNNAFRNCCGLTSVTIPNSVTNIGRDAFNGCNKLTKVVVPDIAAWCGITFSNGYANPLYYAHRLFSDLNTEVKNLIIPEGVPSIGNYAFYGCTSLNSVTIPNSVTNIGGVALYDCARLKDVYCHAENVPSTQNNTFQVGIIANSTLYVPEKSLDSYKATSPWAYFGEILPIDNNMIYNLTYIVDGVVYKTYEVEYGAAITPEPVPTKEGYTFSGWSYIPETMPATDVVVMGSFSINSYTLTYMVDGEEYKSYDVEYNATITPEPAPTKEGYTFSGWSEIPETMPAHDVTVTGSFTQDISDKCATPTISYSYGKLTFNSDTEDVVFHSTITDTDITSYLSKDVELGVTYTITVYATKEGYNDSDVATATLCWIDVEPATEGIVKDETTEVTEVKALPVLIQTQGGNITIQGAAEGTPIAIYDTSGKQYGSATSEKDRTTISTSLQPGTVAIVKIGEKSVKVVIK